MSFGVSVDHGMEPPEAGDAAVLEFGVREVLVRFAQREPGRPELVHGPVEGDVLVALTSRQHDEVRGLEPQAELRMRAAWFRSSAVSSRKRSTTPGGRVGRSETIGA